MSLDPFQLCWPDCTSPLGLGWHAERGLGSLEETTAQREGGTGTRGALSWSMARVLTLGFPSPNPTLILCPLELESPAHLDHRSQAPQPAGGCYSPASLPSPPGAVRSGHTFANTFQNEAQFTLTGPAWAPGGKAGGSSYDPHDLTYSVSHTHLSSRRYRGHLSWVPSFSQWSDLTHGFVTGVCT